MSLLTETRIGKGYQTTVPREIVDFLEPAKSNEKEWVFRNGKNIINKKGEK